MDKSNYVEEVNENNVTSSDVPELKIEKTEIDNNSQLRLSHSINEEVAQIKKGIDFIKSYFYSITGINVKLLKK